MAIRMLIIALALGLGLAWNSALAAEVTDYPSVLATDTNHDGSLSTKTINNGEDKFLIKANPVQLGPTNQVFQTTKDGVYTSASFEDLLNATALRQLFMAKITPDGSIKLYTLPNMGYSGIVWMRNADGTKDVYLTTLKGRFDKIRAINFKAPLPRSAPPVLKTSLLI